MCLWEEVIYVLDPLANTGKTGEVQVVCRRCMTYNGKGGDVE